MNCFSTNADPNQISHVIIQSHELLFIRPVGATGSGLLEHLRMKVAPKTLGSLQFCRLWKWTLTVRV